MACFPALMQCPRVALSGLTLHSDETHIDDVIDGIIDDGEEQPHTSGGGDGGNARPLPRPSRRKRRLRGSGRHASESPSSSLKCGVSGLAWRSAWLTPCTFRSPSHTLRWVAHATAHKAGRGARKREEEEAEEEEAREQGEEQNGAWLCSFLASYAHFRRFLTSNRNFEATFGVQ